MGTEAPQLDLAAYASDATFLVAADEEATRHLPLRLRARLSHWDRIVRLLCELRGLGRVVALELEDEPLSPQLEQRQQQIAFLRAWDQSWLSNVLVALGPDVPERKTLESEAKREAMFAREWLAALADPMGKYPPLPWRRFIRTTNEENGRFAETFLAAQEPAGRDAAVRELLEAKRKVVNRFPKRWEKTRVQ